MIRGPWKSVAIWTSSTSSPVSLAFQAALYSSSTWGLGASFLASAT